ncbi:MAG: hypothetical protein IH621_09925 [Krumholzibacteria bacterium]|nr:hypothetical protein [Candidatus Krumholzibacteria bacterium]
MRAPFLALFACYVGFAFFACSDSAAAPAVRTDIKPAQDGSVIHGGLVGGAKAAGDTLLLMGPAGSGAPYVGNFQDTGGNPAWHGWTSVDETAPGPSHWNASTVGAISGGWSAWCGDPTLASCAPGDPVGGYGNNWDETLEWRGVVADPAQGCSVDVSALVSYDTEPGYDFCYLSVEKRDQGSIDLWTGDGLAGPVAVAETAVYGPGDYLGDGGDEVAVLFRFTSDGAWSDQDCLYESAGAFRVDDVVVTLSNGTGTSHDFEDGTLGPFVPKQVPGVGDFAQIWTGLRDLDPCVQNASPQVAFIDDGVVVPGTGGTPCISWCYGPGGFIVNHSGGLAGEGHYLDNFVVSPPMTWPSAGGDGARLAFTVFRHEDLAPDTPWMFYRWEVRSTAGTTLQDLEAAPWQDRSWVYYGGPAYLESEYEISDLMVPGRAQVQVRLGVLQIGWVWGIYGDNGTPAPYFDNVRFKVYDHQGPAMLARGIDLAEDAFPASGVVDLQDLGSNSVRFDMARSIAPAAHLHLDHGDSIVFDARAVRAGAALVGRPRLHYKLLANPVFDPFRTAGLPAMGWVECDSARNASGTVIGGRWCADLPDTGFLFPGDVLHYYLEATDAVGGDQRTALLPADTTGFGRFADLADYDPAFTVRALPTVVPGGEGQRQPDWLFWDDAGSPEARATWRFALLEAAGPPAVATYPDWLSYDVYTTNGAFSGVGNGLGAAATAAQLGGYAGLLYTSGSQSSYTLANGDYDRDPSPDVQVLDAWLRLGSKRLIATGSGLASSLPSGLGGAFRQEWLGVDAVAIDVKPLVGGQVAPRALALAGNPVLTSVSSWLAYGGCPRPVLLDAVVPQTGAVRLAEYADPSGAPGGYPYSAATLHEVAAYGARVLSLPVDLAAVYTDPDEGLKASAQQAARSRLLLDMIAYCGGIGDGPNEFAGVPAGAAPLAVAQQPNPFNPRTVITWTMARPGRLELKVYDLRGRLVRTLHDGPAAATGSVAWDGTGDHGGAAASGVYFYEAHGAGRRTVGKMTLLR